MQDVYRIYIRLCRSFLSLQQFNILIGIRLRQGQRRQLDDRVDAKVLEELRRGGVQDRATWPIRAARFLDESLAEQTLHHTVAVHAAQRVHLRTGDGLLIGDDRQRQFLGRRGRLKLVLARSGQPVRFGCHDEIIFVQASNFVSPPLDVLIAKTTKVLVCRRTIKILVASNHKSLVHRRLVNLLIDGNHKIQLPLPVG